MFFQILKEDFSKMPPQVKSVTFIVSIWMFGWGFVDPLFSIFLNSVLNNLTLVWVFSALFSLIGMLITIPLGEIEDDIAAEKFLSLAFLNYAFLGVIYFFSGYLKLKILLFFGTILHGIISPMVFVSARTYLKKRTLLQNTSKSVGLFNMSIFGLYALGMFFGGSFSRFFTLNTIFIAVIWTSLFAWWWTKLFLNEEKGLKEKFFSFLKSIFKYQREHKIFHQMLEQIERYGIYFYYTLLLTFFLGLVESLLIVFIPLFAVKLHLSLSEISFLIGLMYVPYVFSFLFGEIADRYDRLNLTIIGLAFSTAPMFLLYYTTQSFLIAFLTMLISLWMALINPAIEGMANTIVLPEKRGELAWVQFFFSRFGRFIWPLFFGLIADLKGLNFTFLIVGFLTLGLTIVSLFIKFYTYWGFKYSKVNELFKKELSGHLHWLRYPFKH